MVDFDYVIVGAGAAGCVLASRLSEDPGNQVLLLEYGGRDTNPLLYVPEGFCDPDRNDLMASLDAVIRALPVPAGWTAGTQARTSPRRTLATLPRARPAVHPVRAGTMEGRAGSWRRPG